MFLDNKVKEIIRRLEENDYETYVVGGACRDSYIGRMNHDIDLVTTASLNEIKEVLYDEHFVSYQKGITLGIIHNKNLIDISTTNGKTIEEDILRRDFTINTILYHPIRGYIDFVNGLSSIDNKIIKSVLNPNEMIQNDPIRILRAIRFKAQLGYEIDIKLKEAMFYNKSLLKIIAEERIKDEFNKIIIVDTPSKYFIEFIEIFEEILPGIIKLKDFNQFNKYHIYNVLDHTMKVLDSTLPILNLRLAALFHDFEKPKCFFKDEYGVGHFYGHDESSAITTKSLLKKLKYPIKDIEKIVKLVKYHDFKFVNNDSKLIKFISNFGVEDIDLLFALKRADVLGQNLEYIDRIYELDIIEERINYLINSKSFITKDLLKIKGSDLIELGFPKNKTITNVLNIILKKVRNSELENNEEVLKEYAKNLINEF